MLSLPLCACAGLELSEVLLADALVSPSLVRWLIANEWLTSLRRDGGVLSVDTLVLLAVVPVAVVMLVSSSSSEPEVLLSAARRPLRVRLTLRVASVVYDPLV